MRNLSIYYNTYTIVFIFYIFSISSSIAQNKEKAIYQIYEGTQHYEEQLNEIYDILKLGREGKTEEYEETVEIYKRSKGYYSSFSSSSMEYHIDQQKQFDEAYNKINIKFKYKKGTNSQKEFIWTILDKHEKGTDTLLHIYLNLHLYTTQIKGVKYVLVRKVDYKTLVNRTNNAIGYFSFDNSYRFDDRGKLRTVIHTNSSLGNNEFISNYGYGFRIEVSNSEIYQRYNDLELFSLGDTYEHIFKPKGKLLQQVKNLRINYPLDSKKKVSKRKYKEFQGSRHYIENLNEVYDIIKLSLGNFEAYKKAIKNFKVRKGYENEDGSISYTYNFSKEELHYKPMESQDSTQIQLKNLKFPTENKKVKKFVQTIYEGNSELGDTLIHFFLKYHYIDCNLMGLGYNLVYRIDYDIKVDISQIQNSGFYIKPKYDINESGYLTTEFDNILHLQFSEYDDLSMNLEIHAKPHEVEQPYSNVEGFKTYISSEKYLYQYIFRPEKEITEVKNNEFYEEEIDDECGIKELFKQLEELYILYEKDSSEVYLKNALELVDSAMVRCKNLKESLIYVKLECLFLLKEYDSLFVEIDSMDVNNFSLPELKDALRVKYKVQMYKEQGEQEKAESLCKETILSLESKLKILEFPVKKKNTISTIFEFKMLFESKEKVTKDLQLYKEKYPQFEELFEEITWTIDYKYEQR